MLFLEDFGTVVQSLSSYEVHLRMGFPAGIRIAPNRKAQIMKDKTSNLTGSGLIDSKIPLSRIRRREVGYSIERLDSAIYADTRSGI